MNKGKTDNSNGKTTMGRREAILTTAAGLGAISLPGWSSKMSTDPKEKPTPANSPALYSIQDATSGQFTTFNPQTKQKAVPIKLGEKVTLAERSKPGIITRMWFTFGGWFWPLWNVKEETRPDPTILKKLILRIYWDGNDYPSVEAPMGDFFGIGQCEYKQYLSKYIGMSSGGFYSYFPMPFQKIRIELENFHERVKPYVFLNANYTVMDSLPENAGRFHCMYNAGTNPGEDPLPILKAKGHGHYVGCCLSLQSKLPNYLSYLESAPYYYIDTEERSRPTFTGTGTEDYFNGGWYFREGEFVGLLHGVPLKDQYRSMISMYRFHEEDAVFFKKNIEMAFINPRKHARTFKFSSTAYWYQKEPSKLAFTLPTKDKLVDWYHIRDTGHAPIRKYRNDIEIRS